MGKYDSIIHKYGHPYYQKVDRMSSNLHILTDVTNSRWFSEVNTIRTCVPSEAGYHGGYYQKLRITEQFENEFPNWNEIKL